MRRLSSSIRTQNRTVVASLSIPGTTVRLDYDSSRALGNVGDRSVTFPVSGDSVPDSLKRIELSIHVAGREFDETLPPAPNQSYTFDWDGRDDAGRRIMGDTEGVIELGYVYDGTYVSVQAQREQGVEAFGGSRAFLTGGSSDNTDFEQAEGRDEATLVTRSSVSLSGRPTTPLGFGGWKPSAMRSPDELRGRSDGTPEDASANSIEALVSSFGALVADGSADEPEFRGLYSDGMAFGPDGTLYGIGDFQRTVWAVPRSVWAEQGGPPGQEVRDSVPYSALTRVAGTGEYGYSGDSGPAREAAFGNLRSIVVDAEGTVYVADNDFRVIRRITPDGTVDTIAGTAHTASVEDRSNFSEQPTPNADLGRATETDLNSIMDMALGPDGSLIFAELEPLLGSPKGAVRRLTPSGRIEPVAGAVEDIARDSDGVQVTEGPATDLRFRPLAIEIDSEGTVYVLDSIGQDSLPGVIRAVAPDGQARTFAGELDKVSTAYRSEPFLDQVEGDPTTPPLTAAETRFGQIQDISMGPDDILYVSEDGGYIGSENRYSRGSIVGIAPDESVRVVAGGGGGARPSDFPRHGEPADGSAGPEVLLIGPDRQVFFSDPYALGRVVGATAFGNGTPSPDAGLVFEDDGAGRHTRTRAGVLGTTRQTLAYNDRNRVEAFVDAFGNRTHVERDDDGHLSAIEAPTGQRTTFETDARGHLSTVTFPDGRTIDITMTSEGLVEQLVDPAGNATAYAYDAGGVTERTDPTGATTTVTSSFSDDDGIYRTTRISPELRESTHEIERTPHGTRFTSTCCGGRTTGTTVAGSWGDEWEISNADGGTRMLTQGLDPRFSGLAPVTAEAVDISPGGRRRIARTHRSVEWDGTLGPDAVNSFTETVEFEADGRTRTYELSYDGADTFRVRTPEGRTIDRRIDGNGYVSSIETDGVAPVSLSRDDRGRVTTITQTGATTTVAYDGDGNLTSVTDAAGAAVQYDRDEAGRVTMLTRPSGSAETFEYDANGNLTRLIRPNGDVHAFSYTARNRLEAYDSPEGGTEATTYDGDGLPTERTLPSGRTITNVFGPGRDLRSADHPDATVTYARDDAGRPTEVVRSPTSDDPDQTVSVVRDGQAIEELAYDGPVSGTFEYGIDALGRRTAVTYPDGTTRPFEYDADGLVTTAGRFSVTRAGPSGAVTELSDGTLTVEISYDDRGRISGRTHSVNGTAFYTIDLKYDADGSLTERTETVDGATRTEVVSYDADDRLTRVERDGTAVERYEYDANNNRTEKRVDGTEKTATYGPGDRLRDRGGTGYRYDADGFVTERGGDAFAYSAIGELLTFTGSDPAGNTTVTYTYDGQGRRVARTGPDTTTEYLYGHPRDPWQLSVVRETGPTAESTVRTQYYYDPDGRVTAFDRDGDRYYVATDQVGTPRIVVTADGTVAKTIDRTAFGEVRTDSAPDFPLHVGFAGGIADPASDTVRLGYRDYEPAAGRFLARDPLRQRSGQYNFYVYGHNDPLALADRNGLSCYWEAVTEDISDTMDYASPLKNAVSGYKALRTAGGAGEAVDSATKAAAGSQASKAVSTSNPLTGTVKSAVSAALGETVYGAAVGTLGTGGTAVPSGAATAGTVSAVGWAAVEAVTVEATLWGTVSATSAVSNLPKLAGSEYRSATEMLSDAAFRAIHGDSPYAFERSPPRDGGGGGCGDKSPENC